MKKAMRLISLTLTGILLLSLAIPAIGFAESPFGSQQNNEDRKGPPAFVYEKMLKNFTEIDGQMIKLNHMNINFDTPPVIKEGRTLIPVRAITEGMGGTVLWNGEAKTVTITHPDSDIEIVFYLETGVVTVDGEEVDIDVPPGLHNNRTYVPLRFIAETFGLKVSHDNASGHTEIVNGPKLVPSKVVFEELVDVVAVDVKLILNDYTFEGIEGLDEGVDVGDEYTYDSDDTTVTLSESYIEALEAEKTTLKFQFADGDNDVEKSFKIMLAYNEDVDAEDEDADEEPKISPEKVTFEEAVDIEDVLVTLTLNGYSFEGIEGLDEGDDYDVVGNAVTIEEAYITGLEAEETKLNFLFEKDSATEKEEFEIKLSFNDEDIKPDISPEKAKFDSVDEVIDVEVTLDLNGHTFEKIMNGDDTLVLDTDYSIDGSVVTLDDDYLKALADEETTLKFIFENGDSEEVEVEFEVEIQGLE